MIPIRAHEAHVVERFTLAEVAEPIELTLGMDESWSPRVQGTLTVAENAIQWPTVAIEKRQGDWITLTLETRYGPTFTLWDLTADFGGSIAAVSAAHGGSVEAITQAYTRPWNPRENLLPLSAATARWGGSVAAVTADVGGGVEAITRALRVPGGSYLIPETERMLARLKVRKITPDYDAGTITYDLASADVRLHEYRRTDTSVWMSPTTSLRALVQEMIGYLGGADGPPELAPGPDVTIPAGTDWATAQTIWEALSPVLESVGYELWADLDGRYRLGPRTTTAAPVILDADANLISFEPVTDTSTSHADGGIVEYSEGATDADKYDVYLMPGASRILHETRPGIKPGAGAAENIVARARARGRAARARVTTQLKLRPSQSVQIRGGGSPSLATIESLSWDYRTAETTMQLRDLTAI